MTILLAHLSEPEAAAVVQQHLRQTFQQVNRVGGVSLHQTEVMDYRGSDEALQAAALLDTDQHWTAVQDAWLELFASSGGLNFFDPIGLRYYLPAYMDWYIRKGKTDNNPIADTLLGVLSSAYVRDTPFDQLFTSEQLAAIKTFLAYAAVHSPYDQEQASIILAAYERTSV